MILRARGAHGSRRCAHDRRGFAIPRAVTVGARRPVNCILQHAGDRVVVFRRHKQGGVRLAYPTLELRDLGRRVLFLALLKTGMPSSSKVSRIAPSGTSSVAARNAARLYDPRRRLPAIPRIRIGVFICDQLTHSALLMNPKALAQNLLQYFAGAALW